MSEESYRRAVEMNDEAQYKSIHELDRLEFGDMQEAFKEIQREARMWLNEVFKNNQQQSQK